MNRDLIDANPLGNAAAPAAAVVERRVTLSPDSSEEELQQVQDMVDGLQLRRDMDTGGGGVDSEEVVTVTYLQSDGRVSEGVDALEAMELDLDDIEVSGEDSDQEVLEMVGRYCRSLLGGDN